MNGMKSHGVRENGGRRGRGKGIEGKVVVGVVSGSSAECVQKQSPFGGGDLEVGGYDPKRGGQLLRYRYHGSGVEGGNSDLNRRFNTSITYHDFLHGFQVGRSTGIPTVKVKLIQQVTAMREEVLYAILLEMQKAYYDLDRSRLLDILGGYVVGPRTLHLLFIYW